MRPPPRSTLFPYTTLFRSHRARGLEQRQFQPQCRVVGLSLDQMRPVRSEEHTSELQSRENLVCRLLLERCGHHRDLHSFPTRRSSDLTARGVSSNGNSSPSAVSSGSVSIRCARSDRKSTRLNSSHVKISYAVFCLKDAATTEIYTLSLHDALPISPRAGSRATAIPAPVPCRRAQSRSDAPG